MRHFSPAIENLTTKDLTNSSEVCSFALVKERNANDPEKFGLLMRSALVRSDLGTVFSVESRRFADFAA